MGRGGAGRVLLFEAGIAVFYSLLVFSVFFGEVNKKRKNFFRESQRDP
jgi:hypothetical protein